MTAGGTHKARKETRRDSMTICTVETPWTDAGLEGKKYKVGLTVQTAQKWKNLN